jgi:hypothetical protein
MLITKLITCVLARSDEVKYVMNSVAEIDVDQSPFLNISPGIEWVGPVALYDEPRRIEQELGQSPFTGPQHTEYNDAADTEDPLKDVQEEAVVFSEILQNVQISNFLFTSHCTAEEAANRAFREWLKKMTNTSAPLLDITQILSTASQATPKIPLATSFEPDSAKIPKWANLQRGVSRAINKRDSERHKDKGGRGWGEERGTKDKDPTSLKTAITRVRGSRVTSSFSFSKPGPSSSLTGTSFASSHVSPTLSSPDTRLREPSPSSTPGNISPKFGNISPRFRSGTAEADSRKPQRGGSPVSPIPSDPLKHPSGTSAPLFFASSPGHEKISFKRARKVKSAKRPGRAAPPGTKLRRSRSSDDVLNSPNSHPGLHVAPPSPPKFFGTPRAGSGTPKSVLKVWEDPDCEEISRISSSEKIIRKMIKLEKKYLELLDLYLCVCTKKRKGGRGSDRAGMKRGTGRGEGSEGRKVTGEGGAK